MMPASDLGRALAGELARRARQSGAPAAAVDALVEAVGRLVAAMADGQPCVGLDASLAPALLSSGMAGGEGERPYRPLVLDAANRLYAARYFDYERRLAAALAARARAPAQPLSPAQRRRLDALFAANAAALPAGETDRQRLACALALTGRLAVISGGPGTGKTTTLVALLACVLEEAPAARIRLAAPTGKAAARMLEAVQRGAERLPQALRRALPRESWTVHRLLGARPGSVRLRHDAARPLAADLVVVDEASMLDLALAAKLAEAVPPHARLVLLGDKDQLAAVEAGSVFAALSADPGLSARRLALVGEAAAGQPDAAGPLADTTVWLTRSYRFGADTPIGRLAAALRDGRADALAGLLREDGARLDSLAPGPLPGEALDALLEGYRPYVEALREGAPPRALLEAFGRFRVLCALRQGPRGLSALNEALARRLRSALGVPGGQAWFGGRPVLVTRNDHGLKLYNGDIGVALPDGEAGHAVWFDDGNGGVRPVPAHRLPEHETALAMTVHKSQGSEFDAVALVLPEPESPVLTRELAYTAVTRARRTVRLLGRIEAIEAAANRPQLRSGGLQARLVQAAGG